MNCRKGQALVEMAIASLFLLLDVVGGIIDFGFAFNNLVTLQQIANDAAQFAAEGKVSGTTPSTSDVTNLVNARKPAWWSGQITSTLTQATTSDPGAATVKILVLSFVSPMYTPFYQTILGSGSGTAGLDLSVKAAFQVPQR